MNIAKKKVLLFLAAAYGVILLLTGSLGVYAKENLPGGAMVQAPAIRDFGYAEGEDNQRIIPYAKNSNLSTGRHYECLSSDEKILYKAILDAVSSKNYVPFKKSDDQKAYKDYRQVYYTGSKTFPSRYASAKEFNVAVNKAEEAIYYDHPGNVEFYMVYATEYGYYKKGGQYQSWLVFVAYEDDTKFAAYNNQIKGSLNSLISKIKGMGGNSSWSAYNELVAHDYYCGSYDLIYDDACNGDDSYFDYSHTAYGAIVDGIAVCDGYSAGFSLIMEKLGIPVMIVTGDAGQPWSTGGHAWNMVQLDGNWYEVDTTWDDYSDKAIHNFFNLTTQEYALPILGSVHTRTPDVGYIGYDLPRARGKHWTYDYLKNNVNAYRHDNVIWINGLITDETKAIIKGDTVSVKVDVLPSDATEKEYVIKSSDSKIVSVNGHKITGKKVGMAVIIISTKDGAVSTECLVSVGLAPGSKMSSKGCSYRVTGADTVELTGCSKVTVSVPSTVEKNGVIYKVTAIADGAFKGNAKVKAVKGGKNLTYIGKNAFKGCSELESLKLSSAGIKQIGSGAFYKCDNLSNIELNGNKLSKVGKKAFKGIEKDAKFSILSSSKAKFNKVVKLIKKAGAKKAGYKRKK